jgi:ribosome-dependent ATPase
MFSYAWREALELQRDPVRATLALGGSLLLMFVIGFGITMDVESLRYAVLDRDQTTLSRDYALQLAGSRYFTEHPPLTDYDDLDRRMRSGELSLAIEIPPALPATWRCAGQPCRSAPGSTAPCRSAPKPCRATCRACTSTGWPAGRERGGASAAGNASVETRFRYNPDVKSLPAMVPAVIPCCCSCCRPC